MLQIHSLRDQLDQLRIAFDTAIMQGSSFNDVKKIYIQIKAIRKLIAESIDTQGPLAN